MMRSLYSAVSGLKAEQTAMDVIGNNIANVNTVAYKSQSVSFSDLFYQTTQIATGGDSDSGTGGSNATQIGLGSQVSSISTDITTQGGAETTGNAFDLMINGDSFFIVESGGSTYFTKAGNFTTDSDGYLVTDSGAYVMGYVADGVGGDLETDQVRALSIYSDEYATAPPEATTDVTLSGNLDCDDTDSITRIGYLYDSLGTQYGVSLTMEQTDTASVFSVTISDVLLESDSTGYDAVFTDGSSSYGTTIYAKYDDTTGELVGLYSDEACTTQIDTDGSIDITFDESITGGTSKASLQTTDITFGFSSTTSYSGDSTIDAESGDEDGDGAGKATGEMTSVGIDTDGSIVASYSNGDTYIIGQIAVATFTNASGLEKVGDNMYTTTLNSGEFNGIGSTLSDVGESVSSGVLEMSNVDLATEFTDMIITQRAFQANSRIITTTDTMLEELVNLKR